MLHSTSIIIKKVLLFFFTKYKNKWKNINFDDKKNQQKQFLQKQKAIEDIDIHKILVSKKESYGTKYFIGYDDDVIKLLLIKLPQVIGSVKCFDSNKTMSFKVSDKYNKI